MAQTYFCDECGALIPDKADVVVKKVSFTTVGKGFKVLRSRNVAWLCRPCAERDPAWQREAYAASPGLAEFYESSGG